MNVKKLSRSSVIFREIFESNDINHGKIPILIIRALLRYTVRFCSLSFSSKLILNYLKVFEKFDFLKNSYYVYLLKINLYKIESRLYLANNQIKKYVDKKKDWSNFILQNSTSESEKDAAIHFNNTLNFFNKQKNSLSIKNKIYKKQKKIADINKYFYLYGPNSKLPPNSEFSNYTIILTKMTEFDISNFKESILILNSYTYLQLSQESKKLLIEKYDKIFLPSKDKLIFPFKNFDKGIEGHVCSPMNLGRILNFLNKKYINSQYIIDGFDFYLTENSYSKFVDTGFPLKKKKLTETLICHSLLNHEPLFNFLFVKKIVSELKIVNSKNFLNIINLSGMEYLKKLKKIRNFNSLKFNPII